MSFTASSLFCGEDASGVAAWDADNAPPSPAAPPPDDHSVDELLAWEAEHSPAPDYLERFRTRSLDATARQDAINWMLKVHAHYRFRPATACLAVSYLDRFLSSHALPRGNGWPYQLLSVACLSLAAKMEETDVPLLLDFQVLDPKFVFDPRTVQRMELLVMSNLQWRLRSVTPFDFLSLCRSPLAGRLFARVSDLILSTNRVIDFLVFRPSAIAAAAAAAARGDLDTAFLRGRLSEETVNRCLQLMEEYLIDTCPSEGFKAGDDSSDPPPRSPVGVLDAAACGSCDTQKSASGSANPPPAPAEPPHKRRKVGGSPVDAGDGRRH